MGRKNMGRIIRFVFLAPIFVGVGAVSLAAVAGLFGFVWRPLDLINHGQMILLPVTFLSLLVCFGVFRRHPLRGIALAIAGTGFMASGIITIPEFVGTLVRLPVVVAEAPPVRLMTFNVLANKGNRQTLMDPIGEEDPDIVAIQEYSPWLERNFGAQLRQRYAYRIRCRGGVRANMVLFSRLPLANLSPQTCRQNPAAGKRTAIIAARVTPENGEPFTVVTTHMDRPLPIARQDAQFARLGEVISALEGDVVLAGDLNTTPFSYTLRGFARRQNMDRQTRLLPTWPAPPTITAPFDIPLFLPIDHILTRGDLTVTMVRRAASPGGSDHYPVVMDFWPRFKTNP
jgi:endonuclease/exonuclease/phosphatase (EEP) superfamily protein YafD